MKIRSGSKSELRFGAASVLLAALLLSSQASLQAEDWPQWRGPHADGKWNETGIVDRFAGPQIPIKWRAEIGSGYSGPTVAKGRVYVMDRLIQPEVERVLCFEESTGKELWKHSYPVRYGKIGYQAGPRGCVTVQDGAAYVLGATGRMFCFEAATGKVRWEKDLEAVYEINMPIWGIAASPVLYKDTVVLHIGGKDACIVALDRATGAERWKALSDRAQYATPILVQQAGNDVLICWTGDAVVGLKANSGESLWRYDWKPRNMPIGVATPIVDRNQVFFTSFYDGSLLLKLHADRTAIEPLWKIVGRNERETDALHSIISTPIILGEHIYGVDSYGELRCLETTSGKRIWENLTATPKARWSTIHFVQNHDRVWMFNERGELIISRLDPQGFHEISRAKLLEPTLDQLRQRQGVCWSHPAYANRHVFARNDKELVCANLGTEP